MALKAGYEGVKKAEADKLKNMPAIKEIGTGLELDDGELSATGATKIIEGNPEGSATETLTKLQIGDDIFSIPGNDNTKCYQTDDATESAIVDADYIPFFDASAASGAGAPRKSTWSNFCNKIQSKITGFSSAAHVGTPVGDPVALNITPVNNYQKFIVLVFAGSWIAVILLQMKKYDTSVAEVNVYTSDNTKNLSAVYNNDDTITITLPAQGQYDIFSAEKFTIGS